MRALEAPGFVDELDNLRGALDAQANVEGTIVASGTAATIGLSVGYLFWLVRAEVLIGTVLSSLPAWRAVDPLPVLGQLAEDGDEDEDDDSLESLVKPGDRSPQETAMGEIQA